MFRYSGTITTCAGIDHDIIDYPLSRLYKTFHDFAAVYGIRDLWMLAENARSVGPEKMYACRVLNASNRQYLLTLTKEEQLHNPYTYVYLFSLGYADNSFDEGEMLFVCIDDLYKMLESIPKTWIGMIGCYEWYRSFLVITEVGEIRLIGHITASIQELQSHLKRCQREIDLNGRLK